MTSGEMQSQLKARSHHCYTGEGVEEGEKEEKEKEEQEVAKEEAKSLPFWSFWPCLNDVMKYKYVGPNKTYLASKEMSSLFVTKV